MRDGAAGIDYSHSGRAGYSARRADCRGAELFDGEVLPLWKWGTDQIIFGGAERYRGIVNFCKLIDKDG